MATTSPKLGLVQGMGKELVEAAWPALTDDEVAGLLGRYEPAGGPGSNSTALVVWRSPRPMSAAALVRWGDRSVFVKRRPVAVRTPAQLGVEHEFAHYLRSRGQPVPAVLRSANGATAVRNGDFVYEVHEAALGVDLYRDALSWSPFTGAGHARAAGRALAAFHQAARHFRHPPRAPGVLMSSAAIISAAHPGAEMARLAAARPGLGGALGRRRWAEDFARHCLPAICTAAPLLRGLPRQWAHGDWHASNLTWSSAGAGAGVVGVIDLGLANRTFAVHDLAVALERNTVDWLDLAGTGLITADLEAVDALIGGYLDVRPLTPREAAALVAVLPVVHFEYALSELEYFADVVRSDENADLAYDAYLIGHLRWYDSAPGSALLGHLRRVLAAYVPPKQT